MLLKITINFYHLNKTDKMDKEKIERTAKKIRIGKF